MQLKSSWSLLGLALNDSDFFTTANSQPGTPADPYGAAELETLGHYESTPDR